MSEKRLDGKVAIVTGSSRGIGKAIAERFAAEGAKVTVNWVGKEREAEAVVDSIKNGGGEALSVHADVSSSAEVKELVRATVDRFGRVDILVNNAGVMFTKSVLETTEDEWDRTIDINLKGAYLCAKEVATIMLRQQAGKIIMMSSNSGLYHPSAMRFTEYVVSKAGMNGLTKALALALGPHITVNAICPGWIKTDMIADTDPAVEQRILDETALHRWGTTDDVAGAAVFLASHEADFIPGELLNVAAGRGMHEFEDQRERGSAGVRQPAASLAKPARTTDRGDHLCRRLGACAGGFGGRGQVQPSSQRLDARVQSVEDRLVARLRMTDGRDRVFGGLAESQHLDRGHRSRRQLVELGRDGEQPGRIDRPACPSH